MLRELFRGPSLPIHRQVSGTGGAKHFDRCALNGSGQGDRVIGGHRHYHVIGADSGQPRLRRIRDADYFEVGGDECRLLSNDGDDIHTIANHHRPAGRMFDRNREAHGPKTIATPWSDQGRAIDELTRSE